MRLHSNLKWLFAVAVIALATGPAGAQSQTGGSSLGGGGDSSGQVGFQSAAGLTQTQQQARSNVFISQMEQAASVISKKQLAAFTNGDVVLANCLKDKLSQIDVAIRSAKEHQADLASSDADRRGHGFTMVVVQKDNAMRVAGEANQCIGKDATISGQTSIIATIDGRLPPEDDKHNFPVIDPPSIFVPPSCASCAR